MGFGNSTYSGCKSLSQASTSLASPSLALSSSQAGEEGRCQTRTAKTIGRGRTTMARFCQVRRIPAPAIATRPVTTITCISGVCVCHRHYSSTTHIILWTLMKITSRDRHLEKCGQGSPQVGAGHLPNVDWHSGGKPRGGEASEEAADVEQRKARYCQASPACQHGQAGKEERASAACTVK